MTDYEPSRENGHDGCTDTELDDRDVRALTECMTVLPEGGDIHTVVGENGGTYSVDAREDRCTCLDHQYRDVTCKHARRVAFATGERPVPAWVDTDAVDAHLGEHVDTTPQVAATDGGEVLTDYTDDEDSDECDECAALPDGAPCARCFIDEGAEFAEVDDR